MYNKHGAVNLRHILFCSMISEQSVCLQSIQMTESESRFIELVQSMSTGTKAMVSKGGTHLRFYPGVITANDGVHYQFHCGTQRGLSYYLQYILLLGLFGKHALDVILTGPTDTIEDVSVDTLANELVPYLKQHYNVDHQLTVKVVKRGPSGRIHVVVPTVNKLRKINLTKKGLVKRVRGVCAGGNLATSVLNQIKDIVKAKLLQYLPDVWIHTDFEKNNPQIKGYSLSLKAQTTTGAIVSVDNCWQEGVKLEEFARKTTLQFLNEIQNCGYVSTNYQWFALTLMALSQKKTSSILIGRLSAYTVECLRIIKDMFGVVFEIDEETIVFRCLGAGYENLARIVS